MATLKGNTFPSDKSGQGLLSKVKRASTNLTGVGGSKDGVYLTAPTKLDPERDMLRPDYRSVWQQCTIEYDPNEKGAEVATGIRALKLGHFFEAQTTTVMDVEKVLRHEYLHLVVDIGWNAEEAQHGQINQIIKYNLKYPGLPNPADPAAE